MSDSLGVTDWAELKFRFKFFRVIEFGRGDGSVHDRGSKMMTNDQSQGLTAERLQLFTASLSGMSIDEMRKAKLLFIKNEISQLRALMSSQQSLHTAQGCFGILPFFRPVVNLQRSTVMAAVTLQAEQITNALDVWGDDLGEGEVAKLLDQVKELAG